MIKFYPTNLYSTKSGHNISIYAHNIKELNLILKEINDFIQSIQKTPLKVVRLKEYKVGSSPRIENNPMIQAEYFKNHYKDFLIKEPESYYVKEL